MDHIDAMTKLLDARSSRSAPPASVGRAADGVIILRPPVRAKHFTQSQIEKTIDGVRGMSGRSRGNAEKNDSARLPDRRARSK